MLKIFLRINFSLVILPYQNSLLKPFTTQPYAPTNSSKMLLLHRQMTKSKTKDPFRYAATVCFSRNNLKGKIDLGFTETNLRCFETELTSPYQIFK